MGGHTFEGSTGERTWKLNSVKGQLLIDSSCRLLSCLVVANILLFSKCTVDSWNLKFLEILPFYWTCSTPVRNLHKTKSIVSSGAVRRILVGFCRPSCRMTVTCVQRVMSSKRSRTTTSSAHVFLDHGWAGPGVRAGRRTEKEVTALTLTSYRPKIITKTVESEPTDACLAGAATSPRATTCSNLKQCANGRVGH